MDPGGGWGGEPVAAAFAGRAAAREAVPLLVCVWLAAVEACWLAVLPAGDAAGGFVPGVVAGCPAGMLDPAGWNVAAERRAGEVGQAGPPAGARFTLHTGQPRRCSE